MEDSKGRVGIQCVRLWSTVAKWGWKEVQVRGAAMKWE